MLVPRGAHGELDLTRARVTDFGIAKLLTSEVGMTRTNVQMGTMPYMAPEQYKGASQVDARADVFAIGMIGWRMLTGDLPVDPTNMAGIHELYVGTRVIPLIEEVRPDVPADLAQLIDAALRVDPDMRPSDALALRTALGGGGLTQLSAPGPANTAGASIRTATGGATASAVASPLGLGAVTDSIAAATGAEVDHSTALDSGAGSRLNPGLIAAASVVLIVAVALGAALASGGAGDGRSDSDAER